MEMVPSSELQIDIFVTNAKPRMLKALSSHGISADPLAPPHPLFARERKALSSSEKKSHSPSPSDGSVETDEDVDSDVDLSYYESDVANVDNGELGHDEHVLDLTNFEDEDDTVLPGEDLLSMAVKEEGRKRRSFFRRSMLIAGKPEQGYRASMYGGPGARSSTRLLDDTPSSGAMRALAPHPEASTSNVHLISPLSTTTTATPSSAAPLLGDRDAPRFTFPPEPRISFTQIREESPRPSSVFSTWSDTHSLAALVSEAAARDQIKLELDEEEVLDLSAVAERARAGRPVFQRILADEVEHSKGSIIVGCKYFLEIIFASTSLMVIFYL